MDPSAASYIERKADHELFDALLAGEYVFLLDSRQKGKSSMVARTIIKLKEVGVATVKLDLQRIGANVTPEQWYGGLVAGIGQELGLTEKLFAYWGANQFVGPLARWVGSLEDVLLSQVETPIVIFIDEVDFVRALPFSTDEFFAAIRDCFNRRSENKGFERLTFCIVGVATPGQLIRNPEITPFNIGTRIDITDFTLEDTKPYESAFSEQGKDGPKLMSRVHFWMNGHPYLTQLLCSKIILNPEIRSSKEVDALVRELFLTPEARQREPNFSDVERRMLDPDLPGLSEEEQRIQVLELYGQVLKGRRVEATENPVVATIRLAGVGLEEKQTLRVRNRLYRFIFDERWRRSSLPDAELRRIQGAARVAVLRTASVSAILITAVSAGSIGVVRLANDRQKALTSLTKQSNELQKTSEERKSALTELERRNAELNRVSGERARAFTTLQQKNEDLNETTRQRERALEDLRKSISERTYVAYLGQMGTVMYDLQTGRMNRLLDIAKATRDNPNRGWEWGSLAMGVAIDNREETFPRLSTLELQPNGEVNVVTSDGIYSLVEDKPRLIQRFPYRRPNSPQYRKGAFRVKAIENPRGDEIDDAATGKNLIPARSYAMIYDVEPKRRLYLLAEGKTLDVIQLRTIDGDKLVASYKGPADSDCAQFLPDGSILSSFSTEKDNVGEVHRWDQSGKRISHTETDQQFARGISLSGDGKLYAVWGFNVKLAIRNVSDHKIVRTIPDQPRLISAVALSRDGSRVIVGGDDAGIRLYGDDPVRNLSSAYGFRASVSSVRFINGEKGFAAIDSSGTLRIWPTFPEPWNYAFQVPGFRATFGAFGDDNETVIIYSDDNEVLSRNIRTREDVRRRFDAREANNTVQVFDGMSAFFVGRSDGKLDRYDGKSLKLTASSKIFDDKVILVERIPNEDILLIGSSKKQFALVDAKTLKIRSRINMKLVRKAIDSLNNPIDDAVAFDAESDQFALYIGEIGKIHVFSAATGKLLKEWPERRAVRAMQFASGGRELVISFGAAWFVNDGETWVYDAKTGKRIHEFKHPTQTVGMMRYAPKTHVFGALARNQKDSERVVFLYDMRTRKLIGELRMEPFINWFTFSPDGERVLAWSGNFITRLWDARTAQEVYQLRMGGRTDFVDGGRRIMQTGGGVVRVHNTLPWETNDTKNR